MRMLEGLCLALVMMMGLVTVTGCADDFEGDPHPVDRLDYPVALTADPTGEFVWVTSGNYDLAFRGGAVLALDVETNRFVPELAFELGSFAGPFGIYAPEGEPLGGYVLSRDTDALYWISFDKAGGERTISCPGGSRSANGILRCPESTAIRRATVDDDGVERELEVGDDPFGLLVRTGRRPGEPDMLLTGAMVDGNVASFALGEDGAPTLVGNLDLVGGIFSMAENPATGRIYTASKNASVVNVLDVTLDDDASATNPFLTQHGSLSVPDGFGSDRARDLAVSLDGSRVYASYRSPDSLVVIDASEDLDGVATNRIIAKIPMSRDPGDIVVTADPVSGQERLYVACFGADRIEVVDGATLTVIDTIRTGDGPFGMALVDRPDIGLRRLYVTSFGDQAVGVIELNPASPSFHQLVAEVR